MKKIVCAFLALVMLFAMHSNVRAEKETMEAFNFRYDIPVGYIEKGVELYETNRTRWFENAEKGMFFFEGVTEIQKGTEVNSNIVQKLAESVGFEIIEGREKHFDFQKGWAVISYGVNDQLKYSIIFVVAEQSALLLMFTGETYVVQATMEKVLKSAQYENKWSFDEYFERESKPKYIDFEYKKVARNPELYEGKIVKLTGKIVQVTGTRSEGYVLRFAVENDIDQMIILAVPMKAMPNYNLLEDDILAVEAKLNGELSYKTVLGAEITLPMAIADELKLEADK